MQENIILWSFALENLFLKTTKTSCIQSQGPLISLSGGNTPIFTEAKRGILLTWVLLFWHAHNGLRSRGHWYEQFPFLTDESSGLPGCLQGSEDNTDNISTVGVWNVSSLEEKPENVRVYLPISWVFHKGPVSWPCRLAQLVPRRQRGRSGRLHHPSWTQDFFGPEHEHSAHHHQSHMVSTHQIAINHRVDCVN